MISTEEKQVTRVLTAMMADMMIVLLEERNRPGGLSDEGKEDSLNLIAKNTVAIDRIYRS